MVSLKLVQSVNASFVANQPLVAVFVGGTSGIGSHTIKALATAHGKGGKGLRAYIIGRNAKAAEDVLGHCQIVCPSGEFHFIRASDLALMKEVDLTCAELLRVEEKEATKKGETPRIDMLFMSQAIFKPFDGRKETNEGLDTHMALLYYSRMRFITRTLPLLLASSFPAHVVSIFGPGRENKFVSTDLTLRSPENYGFNAVGSHVAYLTTFFMEHLAAQNPGKLSLVHYFPGLVNGEGFQDPEFPFWFRAIFKYGGPIFNLFPNYLAGEESGQRTLFNTSPRFPARSANGTPAPSSSVNSIEIAESSDGIVGGGAYRSNYNNEVVALPQQYQKLREEGWLNGSVDHTLKVWEEITANNVYRG